MSDSKRIIRYCFSDFFSALLSWQIFNVFRYFITLETTGFSSLTSFLLYSKALWLSLAVPVFWIVIYFFSGYYTQPRRKTNLGDVQNTSITTLIGVLALFFLIIIDDYPESPDLYYELILGFYIIHFVITLIFRLLNTWPLVVSQSKGKSNVPILVIGTGENARKVSDEFNSYGCNMAYKIMGFVRTGKDTEAIPEKEISGGLTDLNYLIEKLNIEELIIAIDGNNPDQKLALLNKLYIYNLPVRTVASKSEMISGSVKLFSLFGIPMVSLTPAKMPAWQSNIKWLTDKIISFILLILLIPLFIYLAIRVRFDSPGKVFFSQERVGKNGKIFKMYKFRTMYQNSEPLGPKLSHKDDPRVTPFGRIMRKYRLDELPQFFNVLKGDMSLVGPRPERMYFVEQIVKKAPHYYLTQSVLPGITSWGMVKFGYANSIEKMVDRLEYDILYLENQSLMIDFKILVFTLKPLLRGKGV